MIKFLCKTFNSHNRIIFESKFYCMKRWLIIFWCILATLEVSAQESKSNRSTMYFTTGRTGANLREFNQMLADKGLSPMRKGYTNWGLGYQSRFNDFILGFELFQNSGPGSVFNGYNIDYRTTRFYFDVGFAMTEEGRFQLIHYMSIGSGFMNFQMMRDQGRPGMTEFLQEPQSGFILRDGNIHRSSLNMRGFLTEIGFQMSYDLAIPGRDEAFELIAKFGYSFSPFENSWNLNGKSFQTLQSGAFLRLGAGISLPDHNFFYKDASIGAHLIFGVHPTKPTALNEYLVENGYEPLSGRPNNWGLKILGYNKNLLYGVDLYNLGMGGRANESFEQSLNSVRTYANLGMKFFELKNFEIGGLGGLGYANLRYSLLSKDKPDFPKLFEEPLHDGYLRTGGLMAKPELYMAYTLPLSSSNFFSTVMSVHAGYETPLGRYRLGDLSMSKYMSSPYLQFSIGIRP